MWLLLVNHMWSLHTQFLCLSHSLAMTKLWMKFLVCEKKQYHPASLPLLPLLSCAWNWCHWKASETCGAFSCSWLVHSGCLFLLSLLGWCWSFSCSTCWFLIFCLLWKDQLSMCFHWSCVGQDWDLAIVHYHLVPFQIAHSGVIGFLGPPEWQQWMLWFVKHGIHLPWWDQPLLGECFNGEHVGFLNGDHGDVTQWY